MEDQRVRNDINKEKNRIVNDVLIPELDNNLNKIIDFNVDNTKEYIPTIAMLNNIDLRFEMPYENTYDMIETLMTGSNNKFENIEDVGYVFYLNETEYDTLQKKHSDIFASNMIKFELVDKDIYDIDGNKIKGDQLSINNIKYSLIKDTITKKRRDLKKTRDLLKDKDIGTTNK